MTRRRWGFVAVTAGFIAFWIYVFYPAILLQFANP
jgi:hypothetical protein